MAEAGTPLQGLPVDPEVIEVFKQVKFARSKRLMTLVIAKEGIHVDAVADREITVDKALEYFPEHQCRYIIWDFESENVSKMFFFTWCPALAPMNHKTLYSSQRTKSIAKVIKGAAEVHALSMEDVKKALGLKEEEEIEDDENWMDA